MLLKKFTYIVNAILGFLLIGGTLFVTADFDISIFTTADFWWQLIGANIANILLLHTTAKMDIDKANDTDSIVLGKKKDIADTVNGSVQNDFDDFLAEENLKRKTIAWKDYIHNKIAILDKRASTKNLEVLQNGTPEQKKKNRYCRKREKLSSKLDEEYIFKNLVYLRVDYVKLKRYEITNGCKQNKTNYELTTNISKKILKDSLPKYAFSFGITLFASTFSNLFLKQFTVATLIVFVVKLISLFISIFSGKDYAKDFISTTLVGDLQFRRDILTQYIDWKIKRIKKEKELEKGVLTNGNI